MDQLLAYAGFLSFLAAMIIITAERRMRGTMAWLWLSLSSVFHGTRDWVVLLASSYPRDEVLPMVEMVMSVLSYVSLMEFARTGRLLTDRKPLGQWVLLPFVLAAAFGSLGGEAGFQRSLRLALGMPAGLWAAWTFWQAGRHSGGSGVRLGAWAAGAMAVLGLLFGLRGAMPEVSTSPTLRDITSPDLGQILLLGLECVALSVIVIVLWRHAFSPRPVGSGPAALKLSSPLQGGLLLGLGLVILVGSGATHLTGHFMARQQRGQLLDKTLTVAASLDRKELAAMIQSVGDTNNPSFLRLRQQCIGLVNVHERTCYVYILGKKGGDVIFYLDTEPGRPPISPQPTEKPTARPGDIYDDAPGGLHSVFVTGQPTTYGPYTDKWGTYVSGFVPVLEPGTGLILCVVGFDVDASDWNALITRARLAPILITLLLAGLLSMFVIVRERDVTAQARLVRALREKQAILDAASEVAVIACTPEGTITVFNRGAEKMLGYAAAEVVGRKTALSFHLEAEVRERGAELGRASARQVQGFEVLVEFARQQGAEQREWMFVRKDGTQLPVSLAVTATRDEAGRVTGFLDVAVDLTARKRAELELSEKERFISAVAQTSPDFLVVLALPSLHPVYANRRVLDLLGFPAEETEKLGADWSKRLLHPEDLPRVQEHLERAKLSADGELRSIEYRLQTRSGDYRWFLSRDTVFRRDTAGAVLQILTVTQDITEMKRAEAAKNRLEAQLRQAQKLEAVGQLAAGVAHDFNNLLTVIQGNASLMQDTADDEGATYCRQILEAAQRATSLTRQLLLFSRQHLPQPQLLNLGDVIPRVSEMLGRLIGENIRLQWRCDAGLPPVFADPSMIEQVILNLAVNARDAMPNGGNLTLSVETVTLGPAALERHPRARPGRFVCLSVADTGCGIEPKNLGRIFEPFFTTKEVGKGTGLGLATVYGIVEQHHGWIEVSSQVNQGTQFRVYLPVSMSGAVPAPEKAALPPRRGRGEMVLLVEDEIAVREFAERVLRRSGYQVLVASTAVEALELWPRHKNQIELLITDQLMPEGMTGHELAIQLRRQNPNLKVVLTSGYCADAADIAANGISGEFIAKPFTPAGLLKAVQKALEPHLPG